MATETTTACLKQAYDLGINFFDSAEKCVYLPLRSGFRDSTRTS